jgi:carbon-monoxide dehydrogenase large subunit
MAKFGIGQAVRRVEDQRFLIGRGRYVDDIDLPRQCHGALVVSPHAHARIRRVDASRAAAAPGVVCVLTGKDAEADRIGGLPPLFMPEAMGGPKGHATIRPILLADRVRCVGDRVAFVVAETAAQARNAAELVEVDYEPLPAVVGVEDAVAPGAPKVWDDCPTGNVSVTLAFGDKAATDAAFARAKHVVKLRLVNNRLSANPMEPRAAIGDYDPAGDSYTLHTSSQAPHAIRSMLANAVFRIPETRLRVISPDVGGGFGMKADAFPEDALVLWASRRCGRPVKWLPTRTESLIGDTHARDQVIAGELALDADGRILGIRARAHQAVGAYYSAAATAPLVYALVFIPNAYDVQAIEVSNSAVFTHTPPLSVYRGAGRPEAIYFIERLMDLAAKTIGIDPIEIRRRNLIPSARLPYATPTHSVYDSGEFAKVLDRCAHLADWQGFGARRAASERNGKRRGRAITFYIERGGIFNERMELRCDPGGAITIVAGTHSHGQGHATAYAQMVADWLGVPFEQIRFVQGDTDQVPFGRGTYAARSSLVGGCALKAAADAMVEKAKHMAAALMEAAPVDVEFRDGKFIVAGTDKAMPFSEAAKAFYYPLGITDKFGLGLETSGSYAGDPCNYPNGSHVCEVEVDPETGAVAIDRYAVIDDVGRIINPLICDGQIHGGLAQGIGQALMETVAFDRASGQQLSASFLDYAMPRADDFPSFACELAEVPCTTNPLGLKGIGEAGTIGAPPTVVNAILDALAPLGVRHIDMPATAERVWRAIAAARR